jgi:predicted aspartyl protease
MQTTASFLLGLSLSCLCAVSLTPESPISSNKAFSARLEADPGHALTVEDGLQRANDGLFYVKGLSEKQSFTFLVNTGATHVVLSHSDAKRLTLSRLETAGG